MRWNGRYSPIPGGSPSEDPKDDFPIRESFTDCTGKTREFEITYVNVGIGHAVHAREIDVEEGYQFAAIDTASPYMALGKVRDKIRQGLSTRYLQLERDILTPTHDTLKGRISFSREDGVLFVIDGIPLCLEHLGRIASSYEGWEFSLKFIDRVE